MVSLMSLWLPIIASAVLVFIASAILHMLLPFHRNDVRKMPNEDAMLATLRGGNVPGGDYMLPHGGGPEAMKDPAFKQKWSAGPTAVITVIPTGPMSMTSNLIQWFIYCIVVSIFAAYIAGRALAPGANYLEVFRFAGATAFVGYALALWQDSIWWRKQWGTTIRNTIDGLIYGLLTAGVFGWLWPR